MITIDGGTGVILHNGVEIASDKMYDQWVIETSASTDTFTSDIPTGWARSSITGAGAYLTGMSHSSGVFTFPKTGIYRIDFNFLYYRSDHRRYVGAIMELSTNSGGSYADLARSYTGLYDVDSNNSFGQTYTTTYVDVQNASTYRIRFKAFGDSPVTIYGANDDIRTTVIFERIANT